MTNFTRSKFLFLLTPVNTKLLVSKFRWVNALVIWKVFIKTLFIVQSISCSIRCFNTVSCIFWTNINFKAFLTWWTLWCFQNLCWKWIVNSLSSAFCSKHQIRLVGYILVPVKIPSVFEPFFNLSLCLFCKRPKSSINTIIKLQLFIRVLSFFWNHI